MGIFSKIIDQYSKNISYHYLALAIILTLVLGLSFLGYLPSLGCPFERFLHFCCPMCGTTRAWKSLISGNIVLAFRYNPIFWFWGFWCLVAYLDLWCHVLGFKPPTMGEKMLSLFGKNKLMLYSFLSLSSFTLIYLNSPTIKVWRESLKL